MLNRRVFIASLAVIAAGAVVPRIPFRNAVLTNAQIRALAEQYVIDDVARCLRECAVMPRLVHANLAREAGDKGDTIDVPIPPALNGSGGHVVVHDIELSDWADG